MAKLIEIYPHHFYHVEFTDRRGKQRQIWATSKREAESMQVTASRDPDLAWLLWRASSALNETFSNVARAYSDGQFKELVLLLEDHTELIKSLVKDIEVEAEWREEQWEQEYEERTRQNWEEALRVA
jgi:hypothetical protein